MSDHTEKLAEFLREVSNWTWDEFVRAEHDPEYTTNQAVIFALIRACAMQQLSAIKVALNRIDGKLKTPVKIEYPKIFYLFPNAGLPAGAGPSPRVEASPVTSDLLAEGQALQIMEGDVIQPPENTKVVDEPEPQKDLPSMTLRETLRELSKYKRSLPQAIVDLSLEAHAWATGKGPRPAEIPKVKSVVAANLLIMAQARNIDALTEVFDQIDGKLVETIQILGEDIYITSYASVAPDGAVLNEQGILQIEATEAQNIWATKLGKEAE